MKSTTSTLARDADGHDADFIWPVRVYYEDTDSAGIVYYANYLKYMERARTEWLRSLGFDHERLRREDDALLVVSRACLDFHRPARLDDELSVAIAIARTRRASIPLSQSIFRASRELVCSGEVRIACVDAHTLRPRALPSTIRSELERVHRPLTA